MISSGFIFYAGASVVGFPLLILWYALTLAAGGSAVWEVGPLVLPAALPVLGGTILAGFLTQNFGASFQRIALIIGCIGGVTLAFDDDIFSSVADWASGGLLVSRLITRLSLFAAAAIIPLMLVELTTRWLLARNDMEGCFAPLFAPVRVLVVLFFLAAGFDYLQPLLRG